jgi:hypothetical protein
MMNIHPATAANQMHYFAATARAFPFYAAGFPPDPRMALRAYKNGHHTVYKSEVYLILISDVTADQTWRRRGVYAENLLRLIKY